MSFTSSSLPSDHPSEEGISLVPYVMLMWRWRFVIIATAVAGCLSGFVPAVLSSRLYEAKAVIGIDGPHQSAAPAAAVRMVSNEVFKAVIDDVGLNRPPFGLTAVDLSRLVEIGPGDAGTIRITARMPDPQRAAQAANSIARHAIDHVKQLNAKDAAEVQALAGRDLELARQRLDVAETKLRRLRQSSDPTLLRAEVEKLLGRGATPALESDGRFQAERAKLAAAEDLQQNILTAGAGAGNNPAYEYLNRQIAESRAAVADLATQRASRLLALGLSEKQLARVNQLYDLETTAFELETERALARAVYLDAGVRSGRATSEAVTQQPRFDVLGTAVPPDAPLPSGLVRNTVGGFLGGLFLSVICILVYDMLRRALMAGRAVETATRPGSFPPPSAGAPMV